MESDTGGDPAMAIVFDTAVVRIVEQVTVGEASSSEEETNTRNLFVSVINSLLVTCKALDARKKDNPSLLAVMFYERTRLRMDRCCYFLEACPAGIPLFSGHCPVTLSDQDLEPLRLRDVFADRMKTIAKLEEMKKDSSRRARLIRDHSLELSLIHI